MFNNFFNPSFWFTLQPAEVGGVSGNAIFAFFVLMFVLGIVSRIIASQKTDDRHLRELGNRLATLLMTMGLLGILLYFFSYERIRLFGSRFWYLFWVIGLAIWVGFLIRFGRKTIPEMKRQESVREQLRKYFPTRKKRRR